MADYFKLYTGSMDEAAKHCQTLSEGMLSLKNDLMDAETGLLSYWYGKGRNEFEKKFRLLKGQIGDISDSLMQTAENILAAEQAYIQTDTDLAKEEDGIGHSKRHSSGDADDYISKVF